MPRHSFDVTLADTLLMLSVAIGFLWLKLLGINVKERCTEVMLSTLGYLRPRPNPAAEAVLRASFAELDKDLAAVLGDRRPVNFRTTKNAD